MERKFTTYQLAVTALMAAVMCILGPVSIFIGPIPVSLTNLVIFFAAYLLGAKLGTLSVLIYLLLGAVGLPVFSGYAGGVAKLAGPTGGFLIGFLAAAFFTGLFVDKFAAKPVFAALGMVLGDAAAYVLGVLWFMKVMPSDFMTAVTACVLPFLVWDAAKIVLASALGCVVRGRLVKAGLLKGVSPAAAEKK